MQSIMDTIIVAIISAFLGYLFFIWKNRNRPWISILGFSDEIRRTDEKIDIPEKLSDLSRSTHVSNFISPGKQILGDLLDTYYDIQGWLERNKSTNEILELGLQKLKSATNNAEIEETIWKLLSNTEINTFLEVSTELKIIEIPRFDESKDILIPFIKTSDDEGYFLFKFTAGTLRFGSSFNIHSFYEDDLKPIAELVARLDVDNLIKIFSKLSNLFTEQVDINDNIYKYSKPIIEDNSRFLVAFNIINFGPTPFILFADNAELHIKGKHIKPFKLDCYILENTEDGLLTLSGAICLESGVTHNLLLGTKKRQGGIEGGDHLRSAFDKGDAKAYIKLNMLGKEIPLKRKIKSTKLDFYNPAKLELNK